MGKTRAFRWSLAKYGLLGQVLLANEKMEMLTVSEVEGSLAAPQVSDHRCHLGHFLIQLPGLHSGPTDSESLGTFLKIGDGFEEPSCLGTSSLTTRVLIL